MGGSSYKGDDGGSMTSEGRAKAHKTSGRIMIATSESRSSFIRNVLHLDNIWPPCKGMVKKEGPRLRDPASWHPRGASSHNLGPNFLTIPVITNHYRVSHPVMHSYHDRRQDVVQEMEGK